MIQRPFWIQRIETAWEERPIVWLSGVRRAGKTSIAKMIPAAVFINCDLPSSAGRLEDPEAFFESFKGKGIIVLDEVHRLKDPSGLLKIAADEFKGLRILATGSSTLAATRKFRDSLTGRKKTISLSPVLWDECRNEFGLPDLDRRLLHGGLPEALLSDTKKQDFYAEWMDGFYARDILELFSVRDRTGFLSLLRLLLHRSGGLADITKLASESGLSRPTVKGHIEAMTVAHAVFPVRPFHGGGRREIVRRPKIYAFDTGFVTYVRGWDSIRSEDRGILWEHLVLDSIRASEPDGEIYYWSDKTGREVDFVLRRRRGSVDAVECKINPDHFDPEPLRRFRESYPEGENLVISPSIIHPFDRTTPGGRVRFVSTKHLFAGTGGPGERGRLST